ncbi:MAG TPA: type I 3-dehydroquinate dehydratase [Myxococcota bacterium]|nr:type I 3-dehydroquinate dehydratase [Myxococcota bacterium]HRY93225.1 type I 3-dehydroquinate dehydratase [Myxococcota bacterium]
MGGDICVSLRPPTLAAARAALAALAAEGLRLAELRLDDLAASPAEVRALCGAPLALVATCRPGGAASGRRAELLEAALAGGAAFLDLELETPPSERAPLVALARGLGRKLIVSSHDHAGTPPAAELARRREACFEAGADVAKLACLVRAPLDNLRLLALLDDPRPVVVAGMGPLGRVSRVLAPLLGAPFTYASAAPGQETAPGQLDHRALRRLLEELGRA